MNMNWKGSLTSALVLVALGLIALYGGAKTLALVIPVALVVRYGTGPLLGSGRN